MPSRIETLVRDAVWAAARQAGVDFEIYREDDPLVAVYPATSRFDVYIPSLRTPDASCHVGHFVLWTGEGIIDLHAEVDHLDRALASGLREGRLEHSAYDLPGFVADMAILFRAAAGD